MKKKNSLAEPAIKEGKDQEDITVEMEESIFKLEKRHYGSCLRIITPGNKEFKVEVRGDMLRISIEHSTIGVSFTAGRNVLLVRNVEG